MLSPAQFSELIELIQATHENGPKPGVRRAPRLDHPCRITIAIGDNPESVPGILVQLKDISERGMCFLHNRDMPPATSFVVTLQAPGGQAVSIRAASVHCRRIDEHTFQIGAEFTCAHDKSEPIQIERTAEDWMQTRPSAVFATAFKKSSF